MKRDMELVRKILLETEASDNPMVWTVLNIEGYEPEFVSYHVKIMAEAKLIEAQNLTIMGDTENAKS